MAKNLERHYGKGDLHFVTFSCYRRLPLLGTVRARNHFVQSLGEIRSRYNFMLVGYVVMPNHVHMLISETPRGTPSLVLKVLKQSLSRDLRERKPGLPVEPSFLSVAGREGALPRLWQPRFYDFNVWSEEKLREKLDCMHANPVVRKLVDHPRDWPWSSWSFYEKGENGPVPIDPVDW
jgi:putative transposase